MSVLASGFMCVHVVVAGFYPSAKCEKRESPYGLKRRMEQLLKWRMEKQENGGWKNLSD
jgi:hypothetical protein